MQRGEACDCLFWRAMWSLTTLIRLGGVLAFLGSAMSCGSKNLQFELSQAVAKRVQRFPKCQQPWSPATVLEYLCWMMNVDCVHVRETKFSNIRHHTCSKQSVTLRTNTSCAFEMFYLYICWLGSFIFCTRHELWPTYLQHILWKAEALRPWRITAIKCKTTTCTPDQKLEVQLRLLQF